jgi:hypothetical protein
MADPPPTDWLIHCGYELRWPAACHRATDPQPNQDPKPDPAPELETPGGTWTGSTPGFPWAPTPSVSSTPSADVVSRCRRSNAKSPTQD